MQEENTEVIKRNLEMRSEPELLQRCRTNYILPVVTLSFCGSVQPKQQPPAFSLSGSIKLETSTADKEKV